MFHSLMVELLIVTTYPESFILLGQHSDGSCVGTTPGSGTAMTLRASNDAIPLLRTSFMYSELVELSVLKERCPLSRCYVPLKLVPDVVAM